MEISKLLLESFIKHTKLLMKNGSFDYRDVKTANAIRLARKEMSKLEKRINNDNNRITKD